MCSGGERINEDKINMEEKIFSVSEYITTLNVELKKCAAKIIGEVGKVDIYPSGHVYFSLRDEKDQSVINCIIWRSRYQLFGVEIKEGAKIIATGRPDIYKQTGRLSFIANTIELAGEGLLKKEYEKLKKKLAGEGLFEEVRKKAIPTYPQKIGVITSRQGAVLADFLSNIGNYGFKIKMVDSKVEGQSAIADLLSAIETIKKQDIEVLVIMRGGGSFESLQPFNNELLVREIASFPAPVIAAVGHDKDVPLVSLAADLGVSTASIAATAISRSWKEAIMFLERHERNIVAGYEKSLQEADSLIVRFTDNVREVADRIIENYRAIKYKIDIAFQNFKNNLFNIKQNLNNLLRSTLSSFESIMLEVDMAQKLRTSISNFSFIFSKALQDLQNFEKHIRNNNPERQLDLGYSIASISGKIIKSIEGVKIDDSIDIMVKNGIIISKVKNINKSKT